MIWFDQEPIMRSPVSGPVCHYQGNHGSGGVFAPGHLGELTQIVPFEMVDAALAATGTTQARVRVLPAGGGVPAAGRVPVR